MTNPGERWAHTFNGDTQLRCARLWTRKNENLIRWIGNMELV